MIVDKLSPEKVVRGILEREPILWVSQLAQALHRIYPKMTEKTQNSILLDLAHQNKLFLSEDGFVMTGNAYQNISGDRFFKNLLPDFFFRLPEETENIQRAYPEKLGELSAFWVLLDLFPFAYDFYKPNGIWNYVCPVSVTGNFGEIVSERLFEILYLPKGREEIRCRELWDTERTGDGEILQNVIRIAVMEDPSLSFLVPKLGFRYITTLDENEKKHFKITETRTENVWGDLL